MNALLTVLKKELTDAFRDRRMVMVAFVVMPLVFPLIFAGLGTLGAKKQTEKMENVLELPVVGAEHAPNLLAWLEQNNVKVLPPPADADAAVRSQDRDVVLRIDPEYGDDWRGSRPARIELVYDSSRPLQTGTTIARMRSLLQAYADQAGTLRLVARGVHPSVAKPLRIASRDLATPDARFDFGQQMIPYLMILLGFIGGMQLAIDSTAGERERQSLEPLLATPASREAILSGKITATAIFAFLSVFATLISYKFAFTYLVSSRAGGFSMNLPMASLGQMFLVILPVVLLGAALLTALAAFAKSYREAQSYLPMIMFLPMIPTMYLMVSPVKSQLWMMAIPFLSQNQLILKILRKETIPMDEWAVALGAGLLLVAIVWFVAARLYHREQLAVSA